MQLVLLSCIYNKPPAFFDTNPLTTNCRDQSREHDKLGKNLVKSSLASAKVSKLSPVMTCKIYSSVMVGFQLGAHRSYDFWVNYGLVQSDGGNCFNERIVYFAAEAALTTVTTHHISA